MFLNDPNLLIARCGCQQSLGLEPVDQGPYTCCQDCPDAPCLYSIIYPCRIVDPATGEPLLEKCTLLRKDCIVGCGWSSRWRMEDPESVTTDVPVLNALECMLRACRDEDPPNCGDCDDLPDCIDLELTELRGGFLNTGDIPVCYADCIDAVYYTECDGTIGVVGEAGTVDFEDLLPKMIRLRRIGSSCRYIGYFSCVSTHTVPSDCPYSAIGFALTIRPWGSQIQVVQEIGTCWQSITVSFVANAFGDLNLACTVGGEPVGEGLTSTIEGYAISVDGWNTDLPPYAIDGGFSATLREVPDCGISDDGSSDVSSIDTGKVKISVGSIPCHWPDPIPELSDGEVVPAEDDPDQFKKWTLAHGETVSTLTLTTRDDRTAVYTADRSAIVADCRDPITYHQQSADSGLEKLPLALCVVPIESRPKIVCETPEDQCGCCEKGDDLPYRIYLTGCDNIVSTAEGVSERITDEEDLPCGVSWPSSAPCGVFPVILGGAESCGDWTGAVLLLFYCTGSTYAIDVYCYDGEAECWVYQGAATITFYECRCGGPLFAFTLPPLDCCCGTCPTIGDYPNLTLDLVSDCAAFDCEVPLAGVSGSIWDTNGAGCVPQAILTCSEGVWVLQPNVSCTGLPNLVGSVTSLSPLIITFPQVSWNDVDNCCGGGAGASYTMSATVSL